MKESDDPLAHTDIVVALSCTACNAMVPLVQNKSSETLSPGVALVICTYCRPGSLQRFINSLREQTLRPHQLIIVDASPDNAVEKMLRAYDNLNDLAVVNVLYLRVTGSLRGLTRQRNLGTKFVLMDKLAFFDDDVVLMPDCLEQMCEVFQQYDAGMVAGVSAYIVNDAVAISYHSKRWKFRQLIGVVPSFEPGRYFRSGMSTNWNFLLPNEGVTKGDWLPGTAMMWRTEIVRLAGFNERFSGYGQGEDLDFSLRARKHGMLLMAGKAHLEHLHEETGRPDWYKIGYMSIYNRYHIHRNIFSDYSSRILFIYAWTLDTIMLASGLCLPHLTRLTLLQLQGRLRAVIDLLAGH